MALVADEQNMKFQRHMSIPDRKIKVFLEIL